MVDSANGQETETETLEQLMLKNLLKWPRKKSAPLNLPSDAAKDQWHAKRTGGSIALSALFGILALEYFHNDPRLVEYARWVALMHAALEAFFIAGLVAVIVDWRLKEHVVKQISKDVFMHMLAFSLPIEIRQRLHDLVVDTKVFVPKKYIRCSVQSHWEWQSSN